MIDEVLVFVLRRICFFWFTFFTLLFFVSHRPHCRCFSSSTLLFCRIAKKMIEKVIYAAFVLFLRLRSTREMLNFREEGVVDKWSLAFFAVFRSNYK